MKLSNILIAALVTTSLVTSAQIEKGGKDKPKVKTEKKVKKEKSKVKSCTAVLPATTLAPGQEQHYCPACGRG